MRERGRGGCSLSLSSISSISSMVCAIAGATLGGRRRREEKAAV